MGEIWNRSLPFNGVRSFKNDVDVEIYRKYKPKWNVLKTTQLRNNVIILRCNSEKEYKIIIKQWIDNWRDNYHLDVKVKIELDDGCHLLTFWHLRWEKWGRKGKVFVNTSTLAWTYTRTEEKVKNLPVTLGWIAPANNSNDETKSMQMKKMNKCYNKISQRKGHQNRDWKLRLVHCLPLNQRNKNNFEIKYLQVKCLQTDFFMP